MRYDKKMIGKKFYRLTILSHVYKKGYLCKCDCGNETIAKGWALKKGEHKSCGCLMKEIQAKRLSLPNFKAIKNEIFKNYSAAAKRRGHIFNLSKNKFFKLITSNCFYCGTVPNMTYKGTKRKIIDTSIFKYNGVDRVDNTKGYIKNNCVPCCKICNNSKNILTQKEWLDWLEKTYLYQFNKKVQRLAKA